MDKVLSDLIKFYNKYYNKTEMKVEEDETKRQQAKKIMMNKT